MKYLLISILLVATFKSNAQDITLYLKNMDTTSIIVKIKGYDQRIHLPPKSTDSIKLENLNLNPAYEIQSMYGVFGTTRANGMLLTPGRYILVFMWKPKLEAWQTLPLRQFEEQDRKP